MLWHRLRLGRVIPAQIAVAACPKGLLRPKNMEYSYACWCMSVLLQLKIELQHAEHRIEFRVVCKLTHSCCHACIQLSVKRNDPR
jgi:hypothetical protein